jgi:molecular chaperone GrpE
MGEEYMFPQEDETTVNPEDAVEQLQSAQQLPSDEQEQQRAEMQSANDKYLRLYAEFENYRRRISRDKEELIKYGNENLLSELLPVIDNLEMALQHASHDIASGLVQGVEITLKELKRTLEKFGLSSIDAEGKPFDPMVHHAMTQIERDDVDDKTVVEEFRKGYMFKDKVLRPSLVAVSKKTSGNQIQEEGESVQVNIIKNSENETIEEE